MNLIHSNERSTCCSLPFVPTHFWLIIALLTRVCYHMQSVNHGSYGGETKPLINETSGDSRRYRYHVLQNTSARYSWKKFSPKKTRPLEFISWLIRGVSSQVSLSEDDIDENFRKLAQMLMLLREYEARFGLPEDGDAKDQQWVLRELCCHLYA